jgi:hypothetical protein
MLLLFSLRVPVALCNFRCPECCPALAAKLTSAGVIKMPEKIDYPSGYRNYGQMNNITVGPFELLPGHKRCIPPASMGAIVKRASIRAFPEV